MERGRHGSGDYHFFHHHHQVLDRVSPERMPSKSSISSSLSVCPITPPLPPSCSPGASVGGGALCYIEHRISRMDTLAGVAIKYGVEVADIKRLNGLVTDLQMFALKSLQIPLPGRHPPSPILSNCLDNQGLSISEGTLPHRRHSDLFESFQSLKLNSSSQQRVSPAMSKLQGYYGLKTIDQKPASEGFEMAVYRKGGSHYLEDGPFAQPSHLSNPPISHHRKSKSVANGFLPENSDLTDDMGVTEASDIESDIWNEKLIRRRQKLEVDFHSRTTPEMLLKEDNSSGGGFSTITGKGLALGPKATSRTALGVDADANLVNPVIPLSFGDSLVAHGINGVRKSSSASSLQDQESNGIASSIWPTSKWSLKPDLQALSTAAIITRPIFDGLPKPITGRRNKAALD